LLAFVTLAVGLALGGKPERDVTAKARSQWQPFDESAIEVQVATGRTVFVDITADWCLTCKANKKFVLTNDEISQRLFHSGIVAMQGDWTNPDPVIANFLHKFGRYGIPFDVVYGPGAPHGITLPELLTKDAVWQALNQASKP
jgi:suppressor for copper-sensitivity B